MIDWLSSMQQTYEYYIVDPNTWKDTKQVKNIKKSSIDLDSEAETLGSATFEMVDALDECYIRTYLVAIQNGVSYRFPLGTFLVETPSFSFDGKSKNVSVDAYTPLIELKENLPPIGYSLLKNDNIMNAAYRICRENARAPVVETKCDTVLHNDFVANTNDTWMSFTSDLIANAKYKIDLDELGRIIFSPKQDTASLQPVWTYTDDNSSILYPEITVDKDLYGIPNVVEVVYSNGNSSYFARVVNDDPNSPISTVNRGREVKYRDTNPSLYGSPTEAETQEYAENLLRELSTLECTVTYSHGYCPVRLNDCVRLNYTRSGLSGIKARVIKQSIECGTSCKVNETAVYTTSLWR